MKWSFHNCAEKEITKCSLSSRKSLYFGKPSPYTFTTLRIYVYLRNIMAGRTVCMRRIRVSEHFPKFLNIDQFDWSDSCLASSMAKRWWNYVEVDYILKRMGLRQRLRVLHNYTYFFSNGLHCMTYWLSHKTILQCKPYWIKPGE